MHSQEPTLATRPLELLSTQSEILTLNQLIMQTVCNLLSPLHRSPYSVAYDADLMASLDNVEAQATMLEVGQKRTLGEAFPPQMEANGHQDVGQQQPQQRQRTM